MQYIKSYKLFEFNRKDIALITSPEIDKYFTVAFEFELETNDENVMRVLNQSDALRDIRNRLIDTLNKVNIDHDKYKDFIKNTLNVIDLDNEDKTFDEILLPKLYNKDKKTIIELLIPIVTDFFDKMEDDEPLIIDSSEFVVSEKDIKGLDYVESKIEEYLPNFYKEYGDIMKYEYDMSLNRGCEFSPKTYIKGINESLKLLKLFFEDFDNQDYWLMTDKTSIHINIGVNKPKEDTEWNITKGSILLKDWKKDSNDLPFVFYDIPDRIESGFNSSFLDKIDMTIDNKLKTKYDFPRNIENLFESLFRDLYQKYGDKAFGFNIKQIQKYNYVEFRYTGGNLNYDIMKEKTLYFAYIVYAMTNEDYKRKEYLNKLYKFIDMLKDNQE